MFVEYWRKRPLWGICLCRIHHRGYILRAHLRVALCIFRFYAHVDALRGWGSRGRAIGGFKPQMQG